MTQPNSCSQEFRISEKSPHALWKTSLALIFLIATIPLAAREKDGVQYGMGLIINVPFPESEVAQVVEDIAQNGIIRGTKEYNKDEYISGATAATSTRVFPPWTEGGKVFYKVRLKAIDPRNFKDGNDVGTLAVRYVVQPQGDKNTVLRIDAIFVEDFRRAAHASNGSVESAEYKDIHEQLDSIETMKAQTAEAEREKQQSAKNHNSAPVHGTSSPAQTPATLAKGDLHSDVSNDARSGGAIDTTPAAATSASSNATPQTLEEHVEDLRRQVERLVKSPGAALKSAPFHTAGTLQSLAPGTEVLIVISTPYWVGVETHDGQHGWILRDELELVK